MNTNEAAVQKKTMKERMGSMGNNLSLIIAIIGLCVVLGIASPFFATFGNMMTILLASGITLIRASGATIAMITGGMDLSQNSTGAIAGVVCATVSVSMGAPVWVVILLSIGIGLLFGAINGVLIAYLKINPIITTIGTMQIFRGIAWLFTDVTLQVADKDLIFMGRGYAGGVVPVSVIIAFAIFFVAFFVMKYTRFGRQVYMIGGNETASRLSGINSAKIKFICYLISGVCAGFAGMLLTAQVGAALPSAGAGTEMNVIAAIVLGGLSLSGGKGSLIGTLLGVLILSIVANGLQVLGVNQYVQMVVTGCILILAVLIDVIRSGELKKQ